MRRALLALLLLAAPAARAADDAGARAIMTRVLGQSLLGFDRARLIVALTTRRGPDDAGEERRVVVRSLRRGEGLDRSLCFLGPADVKNTAFLLTAGDPPAQYLWVPELGRLRQVSRSARAEPFLSTAFSFRDVEGRSLGDASAYRLVGQESVGGHDCDVVEATMRPGDEYGKMVFWARRADQAVIRVQLFDAGGQHVKTLFTRKLDKRKDGASYARAVRMEDLRTGVSTVMEILDADFEARLDPAIFTPEHLKRGADCAP